MQQPGSSQPWPALAWQAALGMGVPQRLHSSTRPRLSPLMPRAPFTSQRPSATVSVGKAAWLQCCYMGLAVGAATQQCCTQPLNPVTGSP